MSSQTIHFRLASLLWASSLPIIGIANEATLSNTLQLQVPQIRYQADNRLYWAELKAQPSNNGQILFSLQNYGALADQNTPSASPLSAISDQGPPRLSNLTSNSVKLDYSSSTPLACAVLYGTTANFGAIATDPAMNGGAILEHHPVLGGLQPNTQYYYRVQGSATNGKFYWSETSTFTTPAASNNKANLAALSNGAKISAVSSNFGNAANNQTWGANSAIDESAASAWSSNGDGNKAFIEVTFPAKTLVNRVEVWSRDMSDGSAKILSFTIQLDSGTTLGPFTLPDTTKPYSFAINASSKSLRLQVVNSTGGNTGLVEFAAF